MGVTIDGHVTRYDPERLEEHRPLSANVVRSMVTTGRHLVDQCTQPRINIAPPNPRIITPNDLAFLAGTLDDGWVPPVTGEDFGSLVGSYVVPWRVRPGGGIYNAVLRVGVSTTAGEFTTRAMLMPARAEPDINASAVVKVDGTTSGTDPEWVIDDLFEFHPLASSVIASVGMRRWQTVDGQQPSVCMLRLDVWFMPPTETADMGLHGVYLREAS